MKKNQPKIAFLFLTIEGSDCSFIWNDFFQNINKNFYNIYCHPKFPTKVNDFLQPYIINKLIKTNWGHSSLVTATINLIESAIKDNDFFILLSHNSAPLKNFFSIYDDLIYSNKGYIHIYNYRELYNKHHQWFIFNRTFAELVIKNKNLISFFGKILNTQYKNNCLDEKWITTLSEHSKLNLSDYFNTIENCKTLVKFVPKNILSEESLIYEKKYSFPYSVKYNYLFGSNKNDKSDYFKIPYCYNINEYFTEYIKNRNHFFIRKVFGTEKEYRLLLKDNNLKKLF